MDTEAGALAGDTVILAVLVEEATVGDLAAVSGEDSDVHTVFCACLALVARCTLHAIIGHNHGSGRTLHATSPELEAFNYRTVYFVVAASGQSASPHSFMRLTR